MSFFSVETCLVVVASICANNNADIEVRNEASWEGAVIESGNLVVMSEVRSDNLVTPNFEELEKWCLDKVCANYHKICEELDIVTKCTVNYAFDGDLYYKKIVVKRPSNENEKSLMDDIYLVHGATRLLFPLSGFNVIATNNEVPYLRK